MRNSSKTRMPESLMKLSEDFRVLVKVESRKIAAVEPRKTAMRAWSTVKPAEERGLMIMSQMA